MFSWAVLSAYASAQGSAIADAEADDEKAEGAGAGRLRRHVRLANGGRGRSVDLNVVWVDEIHFAPL